jgi:hypothetical protein
MAGPSVRLFISCVSGEFGSYRDALRHALTRPNVEVKIQEDFKALGGDTLHMLEDYIEQCEAIVHFIGDMAGSTPATSSVEDLLARRRDLQQKLEGKGLTREAMGQLTYTQWEAWLAIGFDKDLLIVAPVPGVERGPSNRPSDASLESQAEHLQRLEAIDRYPIKFTSADNLVATILESAVIDALVKAQAAPTPAKGREPFGATIAAIVAGIFVLFIDKMLPLEHFFGELPIFIRVLSAAAAGLFGWFAWRYWDILNSSGEPQGSGERADYDALLAGLKSGGTPARVYRDWLTRALDGVDIFFGDPGRNDKSWFAQILGLETPGARWTAPAFDRCLLLALLYPIITIIAVWAWSGHVGVGERAFALWESPSDDPLSGFKRAAFGISLGFLPYALWRAQKSDKRVAPLLWIAAGCVVLFLALALPRALASASPDSGIGAAAFMGPVAVAGTGQVAGAVAVAGAVTIPLAFVLADAAGNVAVAAAVAMAVFSGGLFAASFISQLSVVTGRQGAFLSLFLPLMTVAAFVGAFLFAPWKSWEVTGPALLVVGVLTLVNAPFDWFAIGLTRALLRRGLAPGGRGPFFYAALDALVAPLVIGLLAFVAVLAVQTFDDIAVLRAGVGARTLPLPPLFDGLEKRPGDPEFWWLWLMLFSTLIPSALNLCIAAASLIRGLPFLNAWIVRRMETAVAMRDSDRLLLASGLSAQIAGGFLATGVALYLIGVWFLPIWLPFFGGYVRDFSDALDKLDAPGIVARWFAAH